MAVQNSLSKKRLPENGGFVADGFPSKFKRRPKPCAVRDFPRNCGPSEPNTGIHSPVKCSSMLESSPCPLASGTNGGRTEGFDNMEKPKILDDIAEGMTGENEQKLGSLAPVWESALEKVAELIVLAREFVAVLDGECSTSKNLTDVAVFAEQKRLMGAAKTVEEGVVARILSEGVGGQNSEEKFGEGGGEMNLSRVRGKNNAGLEMKLDDIGDESMETEGDGVGDEIILSKSGDGQSLDEKVSENGGEGGADVNLEEKDNVEPEMEWGDLGDDLYVLSPRDVKLWQSWIEKRFRAKALMSGNHVKSDGEGGDVVGSQGTEIIVFEEDDSNGEVSVSGKNGENWQEPEFLDLDQYEVSKEQDESMDSFTTDDNLACVEFKDECNDEPKNYQTLEDLVNLCIVKHDRPEGHKVKEALMKFEEHYVALKKERKERKAEMGEGQKGEKYAHIEAAKRLKSEGMCISVQKPFGHIPGIEIGDTFQFRAQLVVVGLHRQLICGIDYVTIGNEKFATCVVDSGRYDNEAKTNDSLIYSGEGGNPKIADKTADQKLMKGNLAMVNSMEMRYPVRVIRKRMSGMASCAFGLSNDSKYVYAYDGLYTVTKYWQERDQNGRLVFKFELIRMPDQPRPRQTVAKSGKLSPRKEICVRNDISQGLENHPIRAMNGVDDLGPPPFTYINKIIYPDWYRHVEPIGCNCINGCLDSHQCPCVVRNGGGEIPFNEKGSIVRSRPIVYECGPNCKCPPSCMNRVSQHRPRIRLEIFKTKERGWGVRTREYVASGSFICEYIGELLLDKEAEQRIGHDEYLFDIGDGHDEDGEFKGLVGSRNRNAFAIDACKFGNVGRFFNHSCSPNMYAQDVLYDHDDVKMPHIMFFATRNIPALHELTYDYNYTIDQVCDANGNIKKKHCFCGSRNCNGRMY